MAQPDNHRKHADVKKSPPIDNIEELKKQSKEYLDGWKRALADYENHKNESAQRCEELNFQQTAQIMSEFATVIDMYTRALKHIPHEHHNEPWFTGLQKLQQQWEQILKRRGVQRIDTVGQTFNPELHEAIETKVDSNKMNHEITDVHRHGYTMKGKVIQPAQVVVNSKKVK